MPDVPPPAGRTHLDHAASSPLLPVALEALVAGARVAGNPTALHTTGRRARAALEDAREQLAAAVGAHPTEVVFTAGGSEADSIAVAAGRARGRVVVGATEHPAVASAARYDDVAVLPCDADGTTDPATAAAQAAGAALVSVMAVNNETGTLADLPALAAAAHAAGAWFHTDAVQALGHVAFDFGDSGADLASLSAHKAGGPVGIGALLVRRDVAVPPWGLGGRQERDIRSGTQPVALAIAFAAAAEHAVATLADEQARLAALRSRLVDGVLATVPGATVNGPAATSPAICNVTIDGTRADDVLLLLDEQGIDCSTGSACRAGVHQPSEVLLAMGRDLAAATGSVRFSLGWTTTGADVDHLLAVLPGVVERARAAYQPYRHEEAR